MSTIQPLYKNLAKLLKNEKFSIDEYQREYKWEKGNITELVDDLRGKFLSCYREGDATSAVGGYEDYFLGSIIVSRRGNCNYLVDGQQRVTSLTLFLIHLYHATKESYPALSNSLCELIYSDNYGEKSFNLEIPERLPILQCLFDGQDFNPSHHDESLQTMHARYQDILSENLAEDLGDALSHFVYWMMNKVGLIEISTDNDNYAYAIFETMNDRGKPLSPVDMLKAYFLAPIDDQARRKQANALWKREVHSLITWGETLDPERDLTFFKAWFRAQYAETIRERKANTVDRDWELIGGSTVHRWARDHHKRFGWGGKDANLDLIHRQLPFFAGAFRTVLEASTRLVEGLEPIFYNAHNEFTWQNTVLLAALCPEDDEITVRHKLRVVADYLDIWILRRVSNYVRVTYSTSSYAMFLLCREIRRKPVGELVEILRQRLAEDEHTFEGCSSKNRHGIRALRLNQFSSKYVAHMLARMTSWVEEQSGQPNLFANYVDRDSSNALDIEHIWPNVHDRFREHFPSLSDFQAARDRIGGLLLLPADVNRSLQDAEYALKLPAYARENLLAASLSESAYRNAPRFQQFLTRTGLPFRAYEDFGPEAQEERTELLLQLANRIWSPDRLDEAQR